MRISARLLAAVLAALLALPLLLAPSWASAATLSAQDEAQSLGRAHAHNDYEHTRPLLDALSHGFTSVEADVWLVDGELLIGHDAPDPARSLQNTYLDPLREIVRENDGKVYRGSKERFRLYIDVKSEKEAWPAIEAALADYPDVVTSWTNGKRLDRAVEVVISGNRDLAAMEAAVTRWSAYDGRLADLPSGIDPELMTVVSDNWTNHFTWMGEGSMPAVERRRLHRIVLLAHLQGYEVRFWSTPDAPGAARTAVWRELLAANVDQVNTDHLGDLAQYLKKNDPSERRRS